MKDFKDFEDAIKPKKKDVSTFNKRTSSSPNMNERRKRTSQRFLPYRSPPRTR